MLVARFGRERGVEPSSVNSLIRVARAFTCFQLRNRDAEKCGGNSQWGGVRDVARIQR
jgi:hypothetical protein